MPGQVIRHRQTVELGDGGGFLRIQGSAVSGDLRRDVRKFMRELLGVDMSKQQQSSDWGATKLTDAQLAYAASDVLYLHALKEKLDVMLAREGRMELAEACFHFLPQRARLDLAGWAGEDIFAHS